MGLISHGIALDASPACHQRTGVDVYCSQSSLRYFVEFDCLQLGEDTSWVLSAGQHTGSCQQSRITTLEHDPPTHPLIAMRARGASRTLTAVVTPPARSVSSPGQVSISQTHTRGLCASQCLYVSLVTRVIDRQNWTVLTSYDAQGSTPPSRRWTASEVRCRTRVPPARRAFRTLILTVCQPGLNVRGQGESRQPSALDPSITCHTPSTPWCTDELS